MAKFYKMAKCVLSWPAQLKNGQSGNHGPLYCELRIGNIVQL